MTSSTQALCEGLDKQKPPRAGPGHSLRRWWEAYWARRAQRASVHLLSSLDDRTLQDIGVNRSEIEFGRLCQIRRAPEALRVRSAINTGIDERQP